MRRFRRVSDDRVQLRLPRAERELLTTLFPQLAGVFDGAPGTGGLRERLFPPAYADPDDDAEFRELVEDDLRAERHTALDTVLRTLEGGSTRAGRWSVALDPDEAHAWLAVLQDTRLVLAQVVGIRSEQDWQRDLSAASPDELVLWHVGAMQEELLDVLMHAVDRE